MNNPTRLITLCCLLLMGPLCQAQSLEPFVTASAGNYSVVSGYELSWTLGEMTMVETFGSSGYFLTQGFHQPEDQGPNSIIEDEDFLEEFVLFPNPARELVNIRLQLKYPGTIRVRMIGLNGVEVMQYDQYQYQGGLETREFALERIAAGLYFIEVNFQSENGQAHKTIFRKLNVVNQ